MPDKKKNVRVQIGILKMNVHISQIEEIKHVGGASLSDPIRVGSMIESKVRGISTEIKLLGMTVDEAIDVLEKYIDDAYLASLHTLRVVHGKGSGSLRAGVQNYLKNNPHVKSYRLGTYGEGDTGVTIVELKN